MNVADILKEFINKQMNKQEIYSVVCTVSNVNMTERTCTCTPVNGGAEMEDIRFQASLSLTEGICIEPKDESLVVVSFLSKEIAFIALHSEVENIYIKTVSNTIFNDGSNDGMVKVTELTTKLNNLVTQLQAELVLIAAGIVAGGGTYTPGSLTAFNANDYKNTKVKH